MIAVNVHRVPREPRNPSTSDAAERIELLRLRSSSDPVARAIAMLGSQILRRLDDLRVAR